MFFKKGAVKLAAARARAISVLQGGGRGRKNHYSLNHIPESAFLEEMEAKTFDDVQAAVDRWMDSLGDVTWLDGDSQDDAPAVNAE